MILKKPLDTPIRYLKGIGPKREKSFKRLGINSVDDLLYYFPRRYEDRTKFTLIAKLIEGQVQTVRAKILSKVERRIFRRRQLNIIEVIVADASSKLSCVWFNQPYLKEYLKIGSSLILYGKTERYGSRLQMNSAEFEVISDSGDDSLNMARIVPIYTLPEGFTQRNLRKIINHALNEYLPQVNDFLAYDIRSRNNLLNLVKSLSNIHFPQDADTQKQAYERLAFEEFFLFQLPLALRKLRKREKKGISHNIDAELSRNFISRLPFKLTQAQEKVIAEIVLDMASSAAMQRLLQGDVGSGKTIVATLAC
ncbi:MAG: DNA helicase RecG, partial [Candidatus Omnitrophica bacterium]|nr:DNA helicase RecG [Candidatus Omnitrophota bacterium]